jgi:hypothetical protein
MKNTKIRFYLEPKSKNIEARTKPELIMSEISYGYAEINKLGKKRYKPARFSLQESILPTKFGKKENNYKFDEVIFKKANTNNSTIKTKMLLLESTLNELAVNYTLKKVLPTPKELNSELSKVLRFETVVEEETTILDFLYSQIEIENEDSDKSKRGSKRTNTIKTYTTISHLIENYEIATSEKLLFSTFDELKYWNLWNISDEILKDKIKIENPNQPRKQRKQSYGYLINSVLKYQKTLLVVLKKAKKKNLITPLDLYDLNLILEKQEAVKNFYVETDLLKKIITTDVSFDEKLQSAKDYFIFASLTGMRFESMEDAQQRTIQTCTDNGYNFDYIHSIHNKTKTEVFIPFLKLVREIIDRNGAFPKIHSNATVNKRLKLLFKYLKFNRLETETLTTYSQGTTSTKKPMSELITTHDCRRTFYSNLYALNMPETAIDNITHPDRPPKNAMAKIYNKTTMLTKTKLFVDEIMKIESDVYTF